MASNENLSGITSKVFDLLSKLNDDDRMKVIKATLTLLGTNLEGSQITKDFLIGTGKNESNNLIDDEQKYFSLKDPNTKVEELAVAARYLELKNSQHIYQRKELQNIILASRRSFDSKHYRRDIDKAKKSGLFTRGNNLTLSDYGQKYVETLPDRESIKKLKSPTKKKSQIKKTSKK